MHLSRLSLSYFRNYKQLDLTLGPGLFLFHGDNAQGKTNLLEAVGMLATANSFHAGSDREVVNWQTSEHIARVEGNVKRQEDALDLEIVIFDPTPPAVPAGSNTTVQSPDFPANTPRKRLKVNGVPRRTMDLIGQMKAVLFAPADLHLVDGSPDERRRYLDRALCQVNPRYCQALVKYRKIVTQRAALLKRIRDHQEDPGLLGYLDEQMTMFANQIVLSDRRWSAPSTTRPTTFNSPSAVGAKSCRSFIALPCRWTRHGVRWRRVNITSNNCAPCGAKRFSRGSAS